MRTDRADKVFGKGLSRREIDALRATRHNELYNLEFDILALLYLMERFRGA